MIYKDLGNTGVNVSILGFGGLRLPSRGYGDNEVVDDEKAFPLIQKAADAGINFFDTGWGYVNEDSQRAIGAALKPYRDKVYFSNKLPLYLTYKPDDFWRYLDKELSLMDTDHIDFYHFHMVGRKFWEEKILRFKLIDLAEKAKAKGLINHIGFSFHDVPELMKEMVDTEAFEVLICQYNMVDQNNENVMQYARDKGVGIIVMGPTAGGNISDGGNEFLKKFTHSPAKTATELAMRFVWANKNVDCALSGVQDMDMLMENIHSAEKYNEITPEEFAYMKNTLNETLGISQLRDLKCTGCRYCDVCPKGIRPFVTITAYNRWMAWGLEKGARQSYELIGIDPWQGVSPKECIQCGKCKKYCPQKIDIPKILEQAVRAFEN